MIIYTIRPGDSLNNIARQFNVSMDSILAANNISNPDQIEAGMQLNIPVEEGNQLNNDNLEGQIAVNPNNPMSNLVIDELRYVISTDRRNYRRGENVRIVLVKTNISNRTITLRYPTSQRFDFVAVRDGREIWRWSRNRSFAQVGGTVTLRPGQSQAYSATWDMRDNSGFLVTTGSVTIRGFNVARGLQNRFATTRISIMPGPSPTSTPTPTPTSTPRPGCPSGNLLTNSNFSTWPNPEAPPSGWGGSNIRRTSTALTSRYAVEMGSNPGRGALLTQRVNALPGRIYQFIFFAREIRQLPSDFNLNAQVRYFNAQGNFIGRADPIFTERSIPENYRQFSFTTGVTPPGTARAEVRFEFFPTSGNRSRVAIDDVDFRCVR